MKRPRRLVLLSALALVIEAAAGASTPVVAQTAPQTTAQLKARCSQLIAYYDRHAVGRSNDSDGRRNHTRIDAEVDCSRGLYAEGISTMENLLRRKKFTPPAPGLPEEPEDGL
ncbi:MAG: hypothetical protein EPO55_01035 [Reyranella sp.]|uniref:hypothetical protein n=1 Tax=Reyranella sp. TaxID=1929291 RepID=UPI0012168708|nr:hypothetical protein [Reyranella sp.]TAJ42678.1 MAG: hypothetical protein EPO55_01035 [Reyranella sp.]